MAMTSQRKTNSRLLSGALWRCIVEVVALTALACLAYHSGREPRLHVIDALPFASHAGLGWSGEVVLARKIGSCLSIEVLPSQTVPGLHWKGLINFQSKEFLLDIDIDKYKGDCQSKTPTLLHAVDRSGSMVAWIDSAGHLYIAQRHPPNQDDNIVLADVKKIGQLNHINQKINSLVELGTSTVKRISFLKNSFLSLLFSDGNGNSTLVLWDLESQGHQVSGIPAYDFRESVQMRDEPGHLLALRHYGEQRDRGNVSVISATNGCPKNQTLEVRFAGTFDCTFSDNGGLAYWSTNGDSTIVVDKTRHPREPLVNHLNGYYSTALNQPIEALAFRTDESFLVAIESDGKLVQLKLRDNINGEKIQVEPIRGNGVRGATGLAIHGTRILIRTHSSLILGELTHSFSFFSRGSLLLGLIAALVTIGEFLLRQFQQ